MGALLKLIICFYLLSLIFSLFCGLVLFIIDVFKWHDHEKKVTIISSKENNILERSVELGRTADNDNDNGRISGSDNDFDGVAPDRVEPLQF